MTTPTTQREADERTLPCPFCGNTDEVYTGVATYCDHCGAEGPSYFIEGKPVAKWNDRAATDQPSAGQVDEMLPCPFCGSSGTRVFDRPDEHGRRSFGVQCGGTNCALCGPERGSKADAIRAWNRRASLTPTAPAPANPAALTVLQEFVDYHTKPAGMTLETAMSADKLGEFLEGIEGREKAMVQRARAVLATASAPQAATTASAQAQQDVVTFGIGITRTHADGTIERIDPLSIYKEPEAAPVQAAQPALPAEPLTEAQIDELARVYFAEEWAQKHVKNAIHDAFKLAYLAAPGAAQTTVARDEAFCDANCVWTDHHPDCPLDRATHPTDKGQTNE